MPGADGFEVLRAAKARAPETEVIMMTAYATVQDAVAAMKQGAYDYLAEALRSRRRRRSSSRARSSASGCARRRRPLRRELEGVYSFHNLVGKSAPMKDVYQLLEQAVEARHHRPPQRRDRDGQGARGARDPLPQRAQGAPLRAGELRRAPGGARRERAVRPREGRVHRRGRREARPLRGGGGGHAVPRRDRRAAARRAGEAQPRAPGEGDPPGRRQPARPRWTCG